MKNLNIMLIILITSLLFGSTPTFGQSNEKQQVVIIQVFEPLIGVTPGMIVVDNNGESTFYELEKVNLRNYEITFGKNLITVHSEIKKWTDKGYKLLTFDKESGDYHTTTIVLVKD